MLTAAFSSAKVVTTAAPRTQAIWRALTSSMLTYFVRLASTTLRAVLADAVLDGLIADNAAAKTPRPRVGRREARHLSAPTVVKILAAAEHERYARVLRLIAGPGYAAAKRWRCAGMPSASRRAR